MTNQLEMVNGVLQPMSDEDQAAYDARQAAAPALAAAEQLRASSLAALIASDITLLRVIEAVSLGETTFTAPDVVTFVNYRRTLRGLVATPVGTLPEEPAFPVGT